MVGVFPEAPATPYERVSGPNAVGEISVPRVPWAFKPSSVFMHELR